MADLSLTLIQDHCYSDCHAEGEADETDTVVQEERERARRLKEIEQRGR